MTSRYLSRMSRYISGCSRLMSKPPLLTYHANPHHSFADHSPGAVRYLHQSQRARDVLRTHHRPGDAAVPAVRVRCGCSRSRAGRQTGRHKHLLRAGCGIVGDHLGAAGSSADFGRYDREDCAGEGGHYEERRGCAGGAGHTAAAAAGT